MGLQQVFTANLRQYRKAHGFTQEKLAELCASDPGYIRQIETGRRFPSIGFIERLADALEIEPSLLFRQPETGISAAMTRAQQEAFAQSLIDAVAAEIRKMVIDRLDGQ